MATVKKATVEQVREQFFEEVVDLQSMDDWMTARGYESITGCVTEEDFLKDCEIVFCAEDGKTEMHLLYRDAEYDEAEQSCICFVDGVFKKTLF